MERAGTPGTDGIYVIRPTTTLTLNAYCDMTRDGGGWTLIVSSHTNTWSYDNVWLRSTRSPDLYEDYSILKYSNALKDSIDIATNFQYRVEANMFGKILLLLFKIY